MGWASRLGQQNRKHRLNEDAPDICLGPVLGLEASALLRCMQSGGRTRYPFAISVRGSGVPNLHETDDDGMGMNN